MRVTLGAPRCGSAPNWCLEGPPPNPPLQLEDPPSRKALPFPPSPSLFPHPPWLFCNAPGVRDGAAQSGVGGGVLGGGGGGGPSSGTWGQTHIWGVSCAFWGGIKTRRLRPSFPAVPCVLGWGWPLSLWFVFCRVLPVFFLFFVDVLGVGLCLVASHGGRFRANFPAVVVLWWCHTKSVRFPVVSLAFLLFPCTFFSSDNGFVFCCSVPCPTLTLISTSSFFIVLHSQWFRTLGLVLLGINIAGGGETSKHYN